jgi:hypothetical protein
VLLACKILHWVDAAIELRILASAPGIQLEALRGDRGEGAEKSGGLHQEFFKEVSFRKGITFYSFLIKRVGFVQSLFPTTCVCG